MNNKVDYKANLEIAIKAIEEIRIDGNRLNQELSIACAERQDVEHIMENTNLNASEGFAMYKKFQEVSRKRREVKNRIEQFEKIEPALTKYENQLKSLLKDTYNKVDVLSKEQPKRKYKLKRLMNLQKFNELGNKQRGIN